VPLPCNARGMLRRMEFLAFGGKEKIRPYGRRRISWVWQKNLGLNITVIMISAPVSQVFVVGEQSILRALRAYNVTKAQLRGELPTCLWRKSTPPARSAGALSSVSLIGNALKTGPINGSITIETNDPQFPKLTVPVSGWILER
jgi:hypothetical protein